MSLKPGDRVTVDGYTGTYHHRSRSGDFHLVQLDEPILQGGPLNQRLSAYVWYADHPAIEHRIKPAQDDEKQHNNP